MTQPQWLAKSAILAIHEDLLAEHGGASGVRDDGLLESALGRPQNRWAYERATLFELAAAYAFGICRNHPFVDGNKRTALMAAYVFLALNGWELTAPEAEAVVMIRDLAAGEIGEAEIADWVGANAAALTD
jgi:death-on-curing protein